MRAAKVSIARGATAAIVAAAAVACGPSFQAIYEGNARFEHCYALEESPHEGMRDKADCWRDWSEHYTYGQTRDRIQYAIARYVALSQAPAVPTDEAMMMAAPGMTPRETTITAPAPTSALAPPPKILEEADAGKAPPTRPSEVPRVVEAAPVPSGPPLPASACSGKCAETYRTCKEGCNDDPKTPGKPCSTCDVRYSKCMRGCFK